MHTTPTAAGSTSGPPPTPSPPPMFSPAQMRQLKVAVIAMGVILLLGFALVIGRIVTLVNSGSRPAVVAAPPMQPQPAALSLPRGAVVRQMAISGNRLAVYFESPEGAGIRIVDLAAGGPAVSLPIVAEAERRP